MSVQYTTSPLSIPIVIQGLDLDRNQNTSLLGKRKYGDYSDTTAPSPIEFSKKRKCNDSENIEDRISHLSTPLLGKRKHNDPLPNVSAKRRKYNEGPVDLNSIVQLTEEFIGKFLLDDCTKLKDKNLFSPSISINHVNAHMMTPLIAVCETPIDSFDGEDNEIPILKALLQNNDLDVNYINKFGNNALYAAFRDANTIDGELQEAVHFKDKLLECRLLRLKERANEKIKILLEDHRIDTNIRFFDEQESLLYKQCHLSSIEYVKALLVNRKTNVNIQNSDGFTPLMIACACSNNEVVEALLGTSNHKRECNIDVNLQNKKGDTALIIACKNRSSSAVEVVRQLLKFDGINVSIRNNDGDTAQEVALKWSNWEVLKRLNSQDKTG